MRKTPAFLLILAIGFSFIALAGCGDNRGNVVKGSVTLKSEGVSGSIVYKGPSGKEAKGGIIDGKYEVTQVEAGKNTITIFGTPGAGDKPPPTPGGDTGKGLDKGKTMVNPPKKYETGGVPDFEVKAGNQNKNDIVLEP